MKKRTKSAGKFKRFYASGIPMYRERNKPIDVPEKAMVSIIKLKTKTAICGYKDMVLSIPLDNFLGVGDFQVQIFWQLDIDDPAIKKLQRNLIALFEIAPCLIDNVRA